MHLLRSSLAGALVLAAVLPAESPGQGRARREAAPAPPLATEQLQGLRWRNLGPANMSGRVTDLAVARVRGAPDVLYVGSASGGVWKTGDWGSTWEPVFDEVDGMISIGDVTVAPSNPDVVWVGTGEANNRQSVSWGDGVYRSTDAGRTWKHLGLKESRHIGRIVVHPSDPDVAYVAAGGHLWGPNAERGVFRTTDGGRTWEKVLYVDEHTGATDLVMDPHDPRTLIAAMYQRQRSSWGFSGGGPGSGIFKSTDGGESWRRITAGLPEGDLGRIGLDAFAADGRIVYAVVEADPPRRGGDSGESKGGIFRSADRGETWERVNPLNVRPMYFSLIRVDPRDPQRIYYGGTAFQTSVDGGRTFSDPGYGGQGVHPDQHAMWIDPDDPNRLVLGNDGGVYLSHNAGASWRFVDNLPLAQFYDVSVDMRDPYYACGGLQDNASWCVPSASRDQDGIHDDRAYMVGSGDGFNVRIDPSDPNVVFAEQPGGNLSRLDLTTGESKPVKPAPRERPARGADGREEDPVRWNWMAPLVMSSHDPRTVYLGGSVLFRSRDHGESWEAISPDLTTGTDRDTLRLMGRLVTDSTLSRHDGISSYANLTAVGESPLSAGLLYTGSDDGVVQVTRDGGATWTDLTARIPGVPRRTYVSRVVPSHHAEGRVYLTFDGHYTDDYRPYVLVSEDFGQTWRSITRGLPEETSVNVITEHPRNPDLLFLGHEKGAHVSIDRGQSWTSLGTNLPNVPVDALVVHPRDNDLVAGTHGRGIWILDDLEALQGVSPEVVAGGDRLLPGSAGRSFNLYRFHQWFQAGQFVAPNPEYGAPISYWLAEPVAGKVQIRVQDAQGKVLRTLEGPGARGLNRVYWDLRMEPAEKPDPDAVYNFFSSPPAGPPVLPGRYAAVVSVPGRGELRGEVEVQADPLVRITAADREARQTALDDLYRMQQSAVAARDALRAASQQLGALRRQIEQGGESGYMADWESGRARVVAVADSVNGVQGEIGRALGTASRLLGALAGHTSRPTADQMRQLEWAHEDLTAGIGRVNALLGSEMPGLYAALREQGVWPVAAPPIAPPARGSRSPGEPPVDLQEEVSR